MSTLPREPGVKATRVSAYQFPAAPHLHRIVTRVCFPHTGTLPGMAEHQLIPDPAAWHHAAGTAPAVWEHLQKEAAQQKAPAAEQPGLPDDGEPKVFADPLRR